MRQTPRALIARERQINRAFGSATRPKADRRVEALQSAPRNAKTRDERPLSRSSGAQCLAARPAVPLRFLQCLGSRGNRPALTRTSARKNNAPFDKRFPPRKRPSLTSSSLPRLRRFLFPHQAELPACEVRWSKASIHGSLPPRAQASRRSPDGSTAGARRFANKIPILRSCSSCSKPLRVR